MLAQRIIYGALAIAILLAIFLIDVYIAQHGGAVAGPVGRLLERGSLVPLFVAMVMAGAGWELAALLKAKNHKPCARFSVAVVAAMILCPWLSAAGLLGQGPAAIEGVHNVLILLALATMGTGIMVISRGDPIDSLDRFASTLFIILYVGLLGSFCTQLRCGRDIPLEHGAWLLLIAALVTKASDIGAFFTGAALGRTKLAPKISPAKTVEGFFGGLAGSVAAATGIWYVGGLADAHVGTMETGQLLAGFGTTATHESFLDSAAWLVCDATTCFQFEQSSWLPPLWCAVVFGLTMSLSGQMGDLLESCFKRDANIKDSGQIMPRFGGILDLVDSPLIAIPVAWYLLTSVWSVV